MASVYHDKNWFKQISAIAQLFHDISHEFAYVHDFPTPCPQHAYKLKLYLQYVSKPGQDVGRSWEEQSNS